MIDLHIHTNLSDGELSPIELINLVIDKGFNVIAITDHDTLEGVKQAQKYLMDNQNISEKLELINGIEITASENVFEDIHILGLFLNPNNNHLKLIVDKLKKARIEQKMKIVEKLNDLGYNISFDEVIALTKGEMGRPHVAKVLMNKYPHEFESIKDVFQKLIGKDKKAYVKQNYRPLIKECVEAIHAAGGLAFVAHPGQYDYSFSEKLIDYFLSLGGDGIEVFYPYHLNFDIDEEDSRKRINFYLDLAKKKEVLICGGSDFHGDKNRSFLGSVNLDVEYLEKIKEKNAN